MIKFGPQITAEFCDHFGRLLDKKLNKRFDGNYKNFCNKSHFKSYERNQRPKNRPKYGAAGYIYD